MSHPPRDLTPLPGLRHDAALAGPVRTRGPACGGLLWPCDAGGPVGENSQAWLASTRAGGIERAWRQLTAGDPLPAIHGRVCYHPCESAYGRAGPASSVWIHSPEGSPAACCLSARSPNRGPPAGLPLGRTGRTGNIND